jgi:hypothetical protein
MDISCQSTPILKNGVTLMKEALSSSKTSVFTRATWRNIPEDVILHRRRGNLKSYILPYSSPSGDGNRSPALLNSTPSPKCIWSANPGGLASAGWLEADRKPLNVQRHLKVLRVRQGIHLHSSTACFAVSIKKGGNRLFARSSKRSNDKFSLQLPCPKKLWLQFFL